MKSSLINYPPLYFFLCIFFCAFSFLIFPDYVLISFPFNLIGILPAAIGYIMLKRASKLFDEEETTFYVEEQPSKFITEGIFKQSRNPMYLGAVVLIIGQAFIVGNFIGFIAPILFFVVMDRICIPVEERIMEETFGKDYLNYKKKVRRWL